MCFCCFLANYERGKSFISGSPCFYLEGEGEDSYKKEYNRLLQQLQSLNEQRWKERLYIYRDYPLFRMSDLIFLYRGTLALGCAVKDERCTALKMRQVTIEVT